MSEVAASRPQLWIIAGPNGAGKTTLTGRYLADRVDVVNPDDIALRIDPKHNGNKAVMVQAGREAIKRRETLLLERKSFAVETTLTGKGEIELMRRAAASGHKVNLVFVGINDAQLSVSRVAQRVRRGGHPVPLEDIFRRFDRSLANFTLALSLAERVIVVDNSLDRRRLVLSIENQRVKHVARSLPAWAKTAVPAALQSVANTRSNGKGMKR